MIVMDVNLWWMVGGMFVMGVVCFWHGYHLGFFNGVIKVREELANEAKHRSKRYSKPEYTGTEKR